MERQGDVLPILVSHKETEKMSECCSRVAAESGSISVRAATHQAHGLGSFPWNKIFELGNKVVRPLQT